MEDLQARTLGTVERERERERVCVYNLINKKNVGASLVLALGRIHARDG